MSKIAYLNCPTGISGDMCLGALVHLGVPVEYLTEQLNRLGIAAEYRLRAEAVLRNGQQATKVAVDLVQWPGDGVHANRTEKPSTEAAILAAQPVHFHPHLSHSHSHNSEPAPDPAHPHDQAHPHDHIHLPHHTPHSRTYPAIIDLIQTANLPKQATAWSLAVFRQLAIAEAAVHGIPLEQVHFHEVGATDAIVDIVGTCLGLDWLGIEWLYCSPLPIGGGTVRAAHGRLPVPAPATLKLFEMAAVPIYSNGIERELVTPTGAAIATTLATRFGPPPAMILQQVGLGAGSQTLTLPNILRLWVGLETSDASPREPSPAEQEYTEPPTFSFAPAPASPAQETVAVLETQIDDLNPQAIGYLFEALFEIGALDVFVQAISMKKSRPGLLLTVITQPENGVACETVIFRETTTLGIRRSQQQRTVLQREIQSVQTAYGPIRVKVAWTDATQQKPANVQPEYEDCARIAREYQIPWREIHRLALQTWYGRIGTEE
jgi:hypothetical protein